MGHRRQTALISGIGPETHYTRNLFENLCMKDVPVELLTGGVPSDDPWIRRLGPERVRPVLSKSWSFPLRVLREMRARGLSAAHLQYEFNMFDGGMRFSMLVLASLALLRLFGIKSAVTIHAVVDHKNIDREFLKAVVLPSFRGSPWLFSLLFKILYRLVGGLAHVVVVHSTGLAERMHELYNIPRRKLYVIPHGIAAGATQLQRTAYAPRVQALLDTQKGIISAIGYVVSRKGYELFLEAFVRSAALKEECLIVFAGIVPPSSRWYADHLRKLAKERGLSAQLVFLENLSGQEMSDLLQASEVIAFPYRYSFAASGALGLALGACKPIVASECGIIAEELQDSRSVCFFKSGDAEDFANKLESLHRDPDLRRTLGQGCRQEHLSRSWPIVADAHSALYSVLASARLEYARSNQVSDDTKREQSFGSKAI